jgi:hypothetical protein
MQETKSSLRKMKDGQTYLFADGKSGHKKRKQIHVIGSW